MGSLPDLSAVLDAVRILSPISSSPNHGEAHWRRVAANGLDLATELGADRLVVLLFAIFHDCMRFDEFADPDHGKRGGFLACCLNGELLRFDEDRLDLLYSACAGHTDGAISNEPTIGACWDADRLDLCRFDTEIVMGAMSTAPGRTTSVHARARGLLKNTPDWASIFWSLEPTAGAFSDVLRRRQEPKARGPERPPSMPELPPALTKPAATVAKPAATVREHSPAIPMPPTLAKPAATVAIPATTAPEHSRAIARRAPAIDRPAPSKREPRTDIQEPLLVAREPSPYSRGPAQPRPQPSPGRSGPAPRVPEPAPAAKRPVSTSPVEGRHYWTATLLHAEPTPAETSQAAPAKKAAAETRDQDKPPR